jgi:fumarylacetoacetase
MRGEIPKMASWVTIDKTSDFSLDNLPYGIFSTIGSGPRPGAAIGEFVLDLGLMANEGIFDDLSLDLGTLNQPSLNAYAALGRTVHSRLRNRLQDLLKSDTPYGSVLRDNKMLRDQALIPLQRVQMHLPMAIGDYTDFFIGLHHAVTVSQRSSRLSLSTECV